MTYLSDLDTMTDGRYAIEWEFETGGRWWQKFDDEESVFDALVDHYEIDERDDESDDVAGLAFVKVTDSYDFLESDEETHVVMAMITLRKDEDLNYEILQNFYPDQKPEVVKVLARSNRRTYEVVMN